MRSEMDTIAGAVCPAEGTWGREREHSVLVVGKGLGEGQMPQALTL